MAKLTAKEILNRAEWAVASQFSHKPDPLAHARALLLEGPQLWAAHIASGELQADGFRLTRGRFNAIWKALGG